MKVTYNLIEPNIEDVDVDGRDVVVTWKCPVTGKAVGSTRASMTESAETSKRVATAVKRSLIQQSVFIFYNSIAQIFGQRAGLVARAASTTLGMSADASIARPVYNQASRNDAVLMAFDRIKGKFNWDEDREQFVAKESNA